MTATTWGLLLLSVFVTATLATAFALTLVSPANPPGASFVRRWLRNALGYGWAAGLTVTAVFYFLRR